MAGDDGALGRYYSGLLLAFFYSSPSRDVGWDWERLLGGSLWFLFFLWLVADRAFGFFPSLVLVWCSGVGGSLDVGRQGLLVVSFFGSSFMVFG